MQDETLIEQFLDHLWLVERLSHNTLAAYRQDLHKISGQLKKSNQSLRDCSRENLSCAIFDNAQKNSSKSRALSAAKRFFAWLQEIDPNTPNPTQHIHSIKKNRHLPVIMGETAIDALLAAPDTNSNRLARRGIVRVNVRHRLAGERSGVANLVRTGLTHGRVMHHWQRQQRTLGAVGRSGSR